MDSFEAKTKVMYYWRFSRNYPCVATEAGKFNSDVLVSNFKEIIDCEIKVSKFDLEKNEIKKRKHAIYANPSNWYKKYLPNKFYLCVPKNLIDSAKKFVENTPYGIIKISPKKITGNKNVKYCKIIKRASNISDTFNQKLHDRLVLRMSSELIRHKLKKEFL